MHIRCIKDHPHMQTTKIDKNRQKKRAIKNQSLSLSAIFEVQQRIMPRQLAHLMLHVVLLKNLFHIFHISIVQLELEI